jgi:hypothetical protein
VTDPGVLIYRCRLCGRLDETFAVPSIARARASVGAAGFYEAPDGRQARETGVHDCGVDGTFGVTYLVGGKPDPNPEG